MAVWDIEEFKIWKGIDKINSTWASRGFACSKEEDAVGLMDYLHSNKPGLKLRVVSKSL